MATDPKQPGEQRPAGRTSPVEVVRCRDGEVSAQRDAVAAEEPLEIRLAYELVGRPAEKSVSVTMRTPGRDMELAAGFLYGEGILDGLADVDRFERCPGEGSEHSTGNILRVHVADGVEVDVGSLQRNFYTTSSCGVCGKASLEALDMQDCPRLEGGDFALDGSLVCQLPDRLREAQEVFDDTGGIHAAGLFDADGQIIDVQEDVGRHNALDKLIGSRLLDGALPLDESVVVLSGRASFELLQKALMAQIPVIVAVGAPSSLAVDVARDFGATLVGFARNGRFNIYSHRHRIETS